MPPKTLLAALLALALLPAAAGAYPRTFDWVPANPADRLLSVPLDEPRYDHARRCVRTATPGARSLAGWLERHWAGEPWGIVRCERLSKRHHSLHAEGRALDWRLDAARPAERREGIRLVKQLLAPDRLGQPHALARRMGVQEIIWDCKAWFSGSDGMRPYSACYTRSGKRRKGVNRTIAHRDHIHFGLSRDGAQRRTSFWQR